MLVHNVNQVFWVNDGANLFTRKLRMNSSSIPINSLGIVYDKAKLDLGTDTDWNSANVLRTKVAAFRDLFYTGDTNDPNVNGMILGAYRFGIITVDNIYLKVVGSGDSYFYAGAGSNFYVNYNCVVKPDNSITNGAKYGIISVFNATSILWAVNTFHEITTKNTGNDIIFSLNSGSFGTFGNGTYTGTTLYSKDVPSYLWINGVVY
jgi:hypothetical protein